MTTGALRRAIDRAVTRRVAVTERCGLCAAPVAGDHRHVLDEQSADVMCACVPCSLLFQREATGADRYSLIPSARRRLADLPVGRLDVPVGLAFFVKERDGRVIGHYPSPLGSTRAEVDADAWHAVSSGAPALLDMAPRVEALLVRTSSRPVIGEYWIVPVDECYRLVAVIRRYWTGMSGGSAVWREIARFFDQLAGRVDGPALGKGG